MSLQGRRVLVTGGTGFLGGRLVEKLIREHGAQVRVLVRDVSRTSRIARFDLEMVHGDVTDSHLVENAASGCEVVFHCAYGNRGSAEEQRTVNVDGTEAVAAAVLRQGAGRLVHVSTMAVYGRTADGDVDETHDFDGPGDLYSQSKREAEELLGELYRRHQLPMTILRPSCVYGPYGLAFTIYPLRELRAGRLLVVDGGLGLCNAVYVDDVVDALVLAATEPAAVGETFLVSGDEPVPWKDFYGAYERMLGRVGTISRTVEELRSCARRRASDREQSHELLRRLAASGFGAAAVEAAPSFDVPSEHMLDFYTARTRLRIDKARRLLGYRPRFDLGRGMKLTESWARWAGLLAREPSA